MGHEDAVILVPEYVEGRLSGPIAAEVGAHLASCADCSSIEEGYRVISTTLKAEAEAAGSRHPSSDSLVAYATGLGALGADAAALERHLEQCADCASDAEATRAAERIRTAIEHATHPKVAGLHDPVTASFGVATFPDHGATLDVLFLAADEALYRAKEGGRNRTELAPIRGAA